MHALAMLHDLAEHHDQHQHQHGQRRYAEPQPEGEDVDGIG
jgi:hypothetical protein